MKRIFTGALFVSLVTAFSLSSIAQTESRDDVLKQIQAKRAELENLENRFLGASEADIAANDEFLLQPDTGITRLLPRETFDNKNLLTTRGGGSYYSFTRRTHEYGSGTQIGLEQDELKVSFAGADYGMLARLGDLPLNTLNLDNPAAKFLASYEAVSEEPQARLEYRRFADGVKVDDVLFKTRQQAIVNNTYVLRGIHYSDSDVLVAFRIVRKDLDDSVIILWKVLRKYPRPVLVRAN
ncbi:MAG TPA: hypothetical protein VKD91_11895 [Pyrinomonadaceae bacterium]|nr:hypothetical protein [Pyrinomonadaceae bacterium]